MNLFQGAMGLFALVMIFAIVFVKAGQFGGATGGAQTASILSAAGGAGSQLVNSLEGSTGNAAGAYPTSNQQIYG